MDCAAITQPGPGRAPQLGGDLRPGQTPEIFDHGGRVIARRVDRHPITISREVTSNGGRRHYRPAFAERCPLQPTISLLAHPGPTRDRVTAELRTGRSPEAIWADLDADDITGWVCVETIYQSV